MKKNLLPILLLLLVHYTKAQQYPLFTNYILNSFGFNPAIAGSSECINVQASHRQQWTGVTENPRTSIISGYSKLKKLPIGVGGYVFADNAGALKRTGGSAALCYAMHLDSNTILSIGASGGYYSLQLGENSRVSDPNDPTYTNGLAGKGFPDFNVGVYLKRKGLWAGFSAPQIFEKKLNYSNPDARTVNELKRHYFLMMGYQIPISKKAVLEPSGMLRYVENAPLSFDVIARAIFNKSFWLGASYRKGDAIAMMLGAQSKGGINFYYAYDLTTSSLKSKSSGTHEFGIGMSLCKKKDRDGDGVPDDIDKCPDKPGPKENNGCPKEEKKDEDAEKDTDKDGVLDKDDQCPTVPGPKENKGCPFADRDNDGLRDDIDKCPDVAGSLENQGCPIQDRDKDGITDDKDPCPDEYGEITNYGCPEGKLPADFDARRFAGAKDVKSKRYPNARPGDMDGDGIPDNKDDDRDGDGIPNSKDPCPNTPGDNGEGCPEIPIEARNAIDFAIRNVYFDTDKAEIKAESFDYLDRLADWMNNNSEYNLDMQGHTDSRASADYNWILSKNRVSNVKAYLMQKGIPSQRIKIQWFGETKPVASGNTETAWRKNRRVEMQWRFD